MSRLIVISNRVAMPEKGGASVGGLTMALAAALTRSEGLWFGWSGETVERFTGEPHLQDRGGVTVALLDLEEQDVSEYYNGYANTVLWPLFHYRVDLAHYERAYGQGYARVNCRFAEAALPLIGPDDIIWVHDYHLIPLAREFRRMGMKNRIGFFLHIPWPARELLTTLPSHRELVESLFDYDLIGFQTRDWLEAFQDYVLEEARGRLLGDGCVEAFGRQVRAAAFPIGIDAESFASITRSPPAMEQYDRAAATGVFRTMMIGVDRIDYSKGLEERFLAVEQLFDSHPELIGKAFLLQIAQTSRGEVEAYQEIRSRLDAVSGRVNGALATVDWTPIRYVNRSYSRDALAGLYRAAKVGLVTPLRDGMNLVCKEYVAAQNPDDPGVLVLSRFAGAALQMGDALIVNPFSREDVADAIARAIAMPHAERIRRWEALVEGVMQEDATWWRDAFVRALHALPEAARAA